MKKNVQPLAALLLVVALALSLAGCSIDLNDMLIVKRAYKQLSSMDSLSFTAEAELDAVAGSLPVKLSATADCQCVIDPTTLKAQLELELGRMGTISLPLYLFSTENTLQVLAGMSRSDGTVWVSNSFPHNNSEEDDELTVETVLNMLQGDPEALVTGESKTINGVLCRPFMLKVPGTILMQALDLTAPEGSDFVIEDTVITIWIAESDGVPMRMCADLASLFQYMVDVADADYLPELKLSSFPVTLNSTGFNNVESIPLPTT